MNLSPVFPLHQVIAVLIVAVGVSLWLAFRKPPDARNKLGLIILRGLVLAGIALLLLNPTAVITAAVPAGKPTLLVLVDTSRSMAVPDVAGARRFDAARKAIVDNPDLLARLQHRYRVNFFSLAEDAVPETVGGLDAMAKPSGGRTYIGESLAHALGAIQGKGAGAAVILSDGRNNGDISPVEVARQAKSRGIPVFTTCLGKQTTIKDVAVAIHRPLVYGAPDQQVQLTGGIDSSGFGSREVDVRLLRDGAQVATKSVKLIDGGRADVSFAAQEAHPGLYRYSIAVDPLPGEVTATNNRGSVILKVSKTDSRVLVLEARPSWDAKFLVQALETDPTIKVDSIFKLSQDRFFALTAEDSGVAKDTTPRVRLPSTLADFAKYDVVILGKGFEDFFDEKAAKELEAYVVSGGHLILARGKPYEGDSPLATMEPVGWSDAEVRDFRFKLTAEGSASPEFAFGGAKDPQTIIQSLPTLISATRVSNEKALTVVLARATGTSDASDPNREMAVLAYQNYGGGIVMSLIGEGLWQWALLPPQLGDYGHCYNDFWTQTVRWMVSQSDFLPGQNLSLRTDHSAYSPGEAVNLMVYQRAKGTPPAPVTITQPDGKDVQVALSPASGKQADYIGVYRPKVGGDYLASLPGGGAHGTASVAPFGVFERSEEDMNTSADPILMSQIATAGGGSVLTLPELNDLPEKLRHAENLFQQKTEPQSVWDRWPILATILGLLSIEWLLRRRMGMV